MIGFGEKCLFILPTNLLVFYCKSIPFVYLKLILLTKSRCFNIGFVWDYSRGDSCVFEKKSKCLHQKIGHGA